MENLGITSEDIDHVYIAGAFGNYIDLDSSFVIGLVPLIDRQKIKTVGNAAGTGAIKALLSDEYLDRSFIIANQAVFIELASHHSFQRKFINSLSFPEI